MGPWQGLSLQKEQPIHLTCNARSQGHLTAPQMAACSLPLGLWLLLLLQGVQTIPQVRQGHTRILQLLRMQELGEVWGHLGLQSHPALQLGVGGGVHRSTVCATQGVKRGKVVSRALRR